MSNEHTTLDKAFEALANAKRRGMINTLAYRPATISQLANEFRLSLPAMHKHTTVLEKAKFINRRKVGRVNFVALNPQTLKLVQSWANQYQPYGSDTQTLENYIASMKASSISREQREMLINNKKGARK